MKTIKQLILTISFIISLGIVGSLELERISLSSALSVLMFFGALCLAVFITEKLLPAVAAIIRAYRKRAAKRSSFTKYGMQKV